MVENQNTEEPKVEELQPEQVAAESAGGEAVAETKYTGFLGKVDNYFGITKMKSRMCGPLSGRNFTMKLSVRAKCPLSMSASHMAMQSSSLGFGVAGV